MDEEAAELPVADLATRTAALSVDLRRVGDQYLASGPDSEWIDAMLDHLASLVR
ncbi:hypothetical protein GCM10022419_105260 [Nonomuraea rosea]|uniref:Uncharacterized protein n=1 Tax=Nonomuraea rosea TaxID=638574 RepID=A0ABP6ZC73_9ACTN